MLVVLVVMKWPDRIAAGFALLITVFAAFISLIAFFRANPANPYTLSDIFEMVVWTLKAELVAALPFWIVLRIISFMFGVPSAKRRRT